MKFVFVLVFTVLASLNAAEIKLAVAANVSYAINDLIKEFNKSYPDTKVKVTLGSSGKLTAQISNGAPFDIFMSANMKYPETLYDNKKAITKPIVYALGSLALISSKKHDLSKGIDILKDKSIKRIAVANPKTAPYGKAALEAFKNAGIYEDIKDKFVYGESISQTLTYAVTATDIGVIAKSSLYSSRLAMFKEGSNWTEINPKLYTPIKQGVVMLKTSKEIKSFYEFILGDKAKKIFEQYGYLLS